MKKHREYRIKITDHLKNISYLIRTEKGDVIYVSGDEVYLALSNLAGHGAVELRFALQDAPDGTSAFHALDKFLKQKWTGNLQCKPLLQLIW